MKIISLAGSIIIATNFIAFGLNAAQSAIVILPDDVVSSQIYSHLVAFEDFAQTLKLARAFCLTNSRFLSKSESLLSLFITTRTSVYNEHPIAVALKIYRIIQHASTNTIFKRFRNYLKNNQSNQDIFNLLKKYLENYTKDKHEHPAFKQAIAQKDFDKLLLLFKEVNQRLLQAAAAGDKNTLEDLIKQGYADINTQDSLGQTPLIIAIIKDNMPLAKALLEMPFHINARSENCNKALMYASMRGWHEVVTKLLELGTEVNSANDEGTTALMMATDNCHVAVVRSLIDYGADVTLQSDDGSRALTYAVAHERTPLVKILLQAEAEAYPPDHSTDAKRKSFFHTVIMLAIIQDNQEIVKLLSQAHAQLNKSHSKCTI